MKLQHWMIVTLLVVSSNVATIWLTKEYLIKEVKVVSMNEIIDDATSLMMQDFKDNKISEDELLRQMENRIAMANEIIKMEDGIVIVKESTVSGGVDITKQVKKAIDEYEKSFYK